MTRIEQTCTTARMIARSLWPEDSARTAMLEQIYAELRAEHGWADNPDIGALEEICTGLVAAALAEMDGGAGHA
jgi:hypothetical protein